MAEIPSRALRQLSSLLHSPAFAITRWELRGLLRGWRAPLALSLCPAVSVLGSIVIVVMASRSSSAELAVVGKQLFQTACWLEAILLLLLPAFALGMMQREYDRGTLDDLLLTRLTSGQIVAGKLLAVMVLYGGVLLGALPLLTIILLFGDISLWQLCWSQALLLASAACLGAIGIRCAVRQRHLMETVLYTYLLTLAWLLILAPAALISMLFGGIIHLLRITRRLSNPHWLIATLQWSALLLLICISFGLLTAAFPVIPLSHPLVALPLLMGHWEIGGIFLLAPDVLIWWLSPILVTIATLYAAGYLLHEAAALLQPLRREGE